MKDAATGTPWAGYGEWKQWEAEAFAKFTAEDAAYFRAELRRTGLALGAGSRVLELGFGNGAFAGWARTEGWEYTGTEHQLELVRRATQAGLRAFGSDVPLTEVAAPGSQDVVVAFDVLEHLDLAGVRTTLEAVHSVLRTGGCLLARVPSGDSPFGRAIFHGDLTHRLALGSLAVRQLAGMCGFEVLDLGPPALPAGGVGLRRGARRLALRTAQSMVGRAINLVFHDGQPRIITANLVFVLRKPVA